MAQLNPEGSFGALKDSVSEAIGAVFPYEGSKNRIEVRRVWVDDTKDIDDIQSQQDARLKGRSWTVPVMMDAVLVDKATGKVKDHKVMRVANLPKVTRRYSYIVNGSEYQIGNQFRLKSGVYHRISDKGEIESQWNAEKGLGFRLRFDPKNLKFKVRYGTSNPPLYPLLKALGVDDDTIEKRLGRAALTEGKKENSDAALRAFYKSGTGKVAPDVDTAEKYVRDALGSTQLRPDSTKMTLGKKYDVVSGEALLASAERLMKMSRGEDEGDNREQLFFKDVLSAEDFVADRMKRRSRELQYKLNNNVDNKETLREIITPDLFDKPLRTFFTGAETLSERPEQINPLEFIAGHTKTTVMGEGGIGSAHRVMDEVRLIDPTHVGFLDPVHTPEGAKTGITLQLPLGVEKKGTNITIKAYNVRTGKLESIDAHKAFNSTVAFPDQVKWVGGKPKPIADEVTVSSVGGDVNKVPFSEVDYVMRSAKGLFGMSANLIPFLQNNQGNRAMTASRQQEQAVALVGREAPLVQSKTETAATFEDILGKFNSHSAPVAGKVTAVRPQGVVIKDGKGRSHEVQLYDHFPLNEASSVLHSTPLVKPGDDVSRGQVIADTNFTRNGELALGRNFRVAYLPFKGYNFEDGIVISETAAEKLTSQHMHRKSDVLEKGSLLDKKRFIAYATPDKYSRDTLNKLDESGVIREGETVDEGDVLIGMLRKSKPTPENRMRERLHKSMVQDYTDKPVVWDKDTRGRVVRVVKHGKSISVHVATEEPATIGDKLVGRHGNKGVITAVLPDHEMPQAEDKPVEVLLNPAGVPGRINLGQVLETAAGKLAEKRGKRYVVDNFGGLDRDYTQELQQELKKNGVSDTEVLTDPTTGKPLGEILTGNQYMFKLKHQVQKKMHARSGGAGMPYSVNQTPKGGGPHGAQALDALGLYALLAHGATANIREMASYKSQRNDQLWTALQAGEELPPPTPSFAYNKFLGYMRVMGVNPQKQGNSINLIPLLDADVRKMSNGELKDPGLRLQGKDLKPEKGGLFDPHITGGIDGTHWSHIELATAMPNPVFEKAIQTFAGLTNKQYQEVLTGAMELNGKTGVQAIQDALSRVDVAGELESLRQQVPTLRAAKLSDARKKIRYLEALSANNMTPESAYMMKAVPVLPPAMRPVSVLDNGKLNEDDVNGLYMNLGVLNNQLKEFDPGLGKARRVAHEASTYDALRALTMTGGTLNGRHHRGVMETMVGVPQPKNSFFQDHLTSRRQDLSMRSTIIPEPAMSIDEVGIPYKLAKEVYKPFVVRKMRVEQGYDPREAQHLLRKNADVARTALEQVMKERPILLKRDPVLHKFGIMAFNPRLVDGKAIRIHPLVTSGYNADFDGDAMSAFVPLTKDAVEEARKMYPSNNLFSPTTGNVMYAPGHEAQLGLYRLTKWGRKTSHRFDSAGEAARKAARLHVDMDDVITVGGKETTLGRLLIDKALPEPLRGDAQLLHGRGFQMDSKATKGILSRLAQEHPNAFGTTVNALKDLGNNYAYESGFSVSLDDFQAQKELRQRVLGGTEREADRIRKRPDLNQEQKDAQIVGLYSKATDRLNTIIRPHLARQSNRALELVDSGARGNWDQLRQILIAPMLMRDAAERIVPVPVTRSYAEGLDSASYFTAMHGARKGMIQKTKEVQKPGALTKDIVNSVMNQLIVEGDAPDDADDGISMAVDDREAMNRFLARPVTLKGGDVLPRNTALDPRMITRLRNSGVNKVQVRSPLKSVAPHGLYARDYGLMPDGKLLEPGTNIGIQAGQALGEPATQLSMKAFHEGGVAASKSGKITDRFTRVEQLLKMRANLANAATLAEQTGTISRVEKNRDAGGLDVWVGDRKHYVPEQLVNPDLKLRRGTKVKRGERLSGGPINPHQLLPLTNINTVRNYLTDEVYRAYEDAGPVQRRNVETVIRSITNLGRVTDAGGDKDLLPNDIVSVSAMVAKNKGRSKPAIWTPILRGVNQTPLDMQTDWMARMQYNHLKDTVVDAALKGWKSDIHGMHPIPGVAYGVEFGKHPGDTEFKVGY